MCSTSIRGQIYNRTFEFWWVCQSAPVIFRLFLSPRPTRYLGSFMRRSTLATLTWEEVNFDFALLAVETHLSYPISKASSWHLCLPTQPNIPRRDEEISVHSVYLIFRPFPALSSTPRNSFRRSTIRSIFLVIDDPSSDET